MGFEGVSSKKYKHIQVVVNVYRVGHNPYIYIYVYIYTHLIRILIIIIILIICYYIYILYIYIYYIYYDFCIWLEILRSQHP